MLRLGLGSYFMWWHSWTCGLWHSTIVYIDWKDSPVTCREETVNEETASPTTGHETAKSCASGGPTTQLRGYQEREKLVASEISCFLALAFYQVHTVFSRLLHLAYPRARGLFLILRRWLNGVNGESQEPELSLRFIPISGFSGKAQPAQSSFWLLPKVTTGIYTQTHTHTSDPGQRHGSAAARLPELQVRIHPGAWICSLWVLSVVRWRSLRRANHKSRSSTGWSTGRGIYGRTLQRETVRVGPRNYGRCPIWTSVFTDAV